MSKSLLKEYLDLLFAEAYDPKTRTWDSTTSKEEEQELAKQDKRIKRPVVSREEWADRAEGARWNKVVELSKLPEYEGLSTFLTYKHDDEQETYDPDELMALALNYTKAISGAGENVQRPSETLVNDLKKEIEGYGLRLTSREKLQHFRGSMSNPHGTSPHSYVVSGGASTSSIQGIGGGQGIVGGKYKWDAKDPKNLGQVKPGALAPSHKEDLKHYTTSAEEKKLAAQLAREPWRKTEEQLAAEKEAEEEKNKLSAKDWVIRRRPKK